MQEREHHVSPIKSWQELVVVVVFAFIVPIAVIVLLTQYVTDVARPPKESDAAILSRIKPVGEVVFASASGPKGQMTGEQVYNAVCKTCHGTGLAGSPKVGDKAAWGKVIAQGLPTLVDHATHGIRAMPPKGGNPDLEDVEVERAIVFMANQGGANWKEPPVSAAPAAAPASTTAAAAPASAATASAAPPATAAAPAASSAAPTAATKPDGKKVFEGTCMVCHGQGLAGAPKFGDKAAWAPRIKTGMDVLYASALKGKNAMPAKGGNLALSDDEVKAAVDYMTAASK